MKRLACSLGLGWGLLSIGSLAACGPTIVLSDEGSTGADEGSTSVRPPSTTRPGTTAMTTVTTTPPDPDTTVGPVTATVGDDVATTVPPFWDDVDPGCTVGFLGEACADDGDCCSGRCFVVGPLGGVCSECSSDTDCVFGCNMGNPLDGTPAVCGDGSIGAGCETDMACQPGLPCVQLLDVPGILSVSTCSECGSDGQCIPGMECAPTYDIEALSGFWRCVDPGSQPIDAGCNGGAECVSGICAPAAIMGIPVVSVCSPCASDADCGPGGSCMLPEVVIMGASLGVQSGMCA